MDHLDVPTTKNTINKVPFYPRPDRYGNYTKVTTLTSDILENRNHYIARKQLKPHQSRSSCPKTDFKCPENHGLKYLKTNITGFKCNVCGKKDLPAKYEMFCCYICNWHCCKNCTKPL